MGWKGTLRTFNAALKRYERESQREKKAQLKELQRQEKQQFIMQVAYERQETLLSAQEEVQAFEAYIQQLISLHQVELTKINWLELKDSPAPDEPAIIYPNKEAALQHYKTFKPSFLQRLLKKTPQIKAALKYEIQLAQAKDEKNRESALQQYQADMKEWQQDIELAKRVIHGDKKAYEEILRRVEAFSAFSSKSSLHLDANNVLSVSIFINGQKTIPTENKSLLKRGDISVKAMPKTKYYELYQDHVCSVALRTAKEVFAFLPVKTVIITVFDVLLDSSTGHLDDKAILSVLIPEETIQKLNLSAIDPSDALKNFKHQMIFKKTTGFAHIDVLNYESDVAG
ncbi:hypothetical protein [Saezia sanguinis]|uniref:hypothetical protein n=1 Tax=Saezia sanguinis TaxID=1965230 RepID=UPI0030242D50